MPAQASVNGHGISKKKHGVTRTFMKPKFRQYLPGDRDDCLEVFCSNIPRYFREYEQQEFASFLDLGTPYFVVEVGSVVACGGYAVREGSDQADLCWGMVTAEYHGQNLGEFLLLGRLAEIVRRNQIQRVRLGTSQLTAGFFEKFGFAIQTTKENSIAEGLDDVEMNVALNDVFRESIQQRWTAVQASERD